MKSVNKFWVISALITAAFLLVLFVPGVFFWKQLPLEHRTAILQIVGENFSFIILVILLGFGGWVICLIAFFQFYVLPTRKIADEMLVTFSANPSFRINTEAGEDFKRLANLINEGADRYQSLQKSIDDRIHLSREALEQEKNILASIISCLSEGIIVCNPSGAILLFNKKAEGFLSHPLKSQVDAQAAFPNQQFIGLGRNISSFINKQQIHLAFAEITEKLAQLQENPGACFAILGAYGHFLKIEVVPVLIYRKELVGYILRINSIKQSHFPADGPFMSNLMVVHSAPSGMLLSSLSGFNLPLYPTQLQGVIELVQGHLLKKRLTVRLNMPDAPVWIYAKSHYLSSAIIHILSRLAEATGKSTFDCLLENERDYVHVDIVWEGVPVAYALEEWNESVVLQGKGADFLKLKDILLLHEAEWWSSLKHKSPGDACFRLFFPSAEPSRFRSIETVTISPSRPEFYDFDLLNRTDSTPDLQEQLLSDITYTVVDTETTGLDPFSDEIISIGAVRIVNGRLLKNEIFNVLVNPERDVPEESIKIHGIRPEMLHGQPTIDKMLPLLHQFTENTVLVGHNVAFDMRMFQMKENISPVRFTLPVLDTMFLSAVIHPMYRDHSLEAISDRLGIMINGRHTALGDALATAEILLKCIPLLARNNVLTLKDALKASRKTRFAKISY